MQPTACDPAATRPVANRSPGPNVGLDDAGQGVYRPRADSRLGGPVRVVWQVQVSGTGDVRQQEINTIRARAKAKVRGRKPRPSSNGRKVKVKLTCKEASLPDCNGIAQIGPRKGDSRWTAAEPVSSVTPGDSLKLKLKLDGKRAKQLRKRSRPLKAAVYLALERTDGKRVEKRTKIKLRPAR